MTPPVCVPWQSTCSLTHSPQRYSLPHGWQAEHDSSLFKIRAVQAGCVGHVPVWGGGGEVRVKEKSGVWDCYGDAGGISIHEMVCLANKNGVFARQRERTTDTTAGSPCPLHMPIDGGNLPHTQKYVAGHSKAMQASNQMPCPGLALQPGQA